MIANIVYILCALTSISCAGLLLRSYFKSRVRLLLWSSLCFMGLALNNIILILDLMIYPDVEMTIIRTLPGLFGPLILIYGLIMDFE